MRTRHKEAAIGEKGGHEHRPHQGRLPWQTESHIETETGECSTGHVRGSQQDDLIHLQIILYSREVVHPIREQPLCSEGARGGGAGNHCGQVPVSLN
jgi:hypothetical protein